MSKKNGLAWGWDSMTRPEKNLMSESYYNFETVQAKNEFNIDVRCYGEVRGGQADGFRRAASNGESVACLPHAAAGSDRFNTESNKVTQYDKSELVRAYYDGPFANGPLLVRPHHCKCRFCPECAKSLGYDLRERLLNVSHALNGIVLLTLTVDRNGTTTGKGFSSPAEAHDYVSGDNKFIARLMRYLSIDKWLWVLEFQADNGDGWPHWHLLVDVSEHGGRLPKNLLQRTWYLWRDKWKIGGLDVEQVSMKDSRHRINFLTKYLVKQPERGWPVWVLERERIRLTGGSRAIGRLVAKKPPSPKNEDSSKPEKKRQARKIIDRISECGLKTIFLSQDLDESTGECKAKFHKALPGSISAIEQVLKRPDSPAEVVQNDIEYEKGTYRSVEIASILGGFGEMEKYLDANGFMDLFEIEVEVKRKAYLSKWHTFERWQAIPLKNENTNGIAISPSNEIKY
ncbi:MAG: hypothetical protein PHN98_11720 [Smithellaceae bacterium]|nr:hypothetical protein [Smithellaceae bacterium]